MPRESNAIMQYLVEKYDTEHKISVSSFEEKMLQLQWLFFQASGQGCVPSFRFRDMHIDHSLCRPYFGQAVWFIRRHSEKLPGVIERYQKETIRVLSVLESVLSKQEWLVGGKCTIADISFITFDSLAYILLRLADGMVTLGGTRARSGSS